MNKETVKQTDKYTIIVCVFDRLDAPEAWSAPRTHTPHTHARKHTHTHTHTTHTQGAGTGGAEGAAAPPVFFCGQL